jgi:hypothetical protein
LIFGVFSVDAVRCIDPKYNLSSLVVKNGDLDDVIDDDGLMTCAA